MKKRIFSVVIAAALMFSSVSAVFAATEYDGLKPLKTAETILDELNADAGAEIFDKEQHKDQLDILKGLNTAFSGAFDAADWSGYINAVYTSRGDSSATNYMKVLVLAESDSDIKDKLATKDDEFDTEGRGLRESFDKLASYKEEMAKFITENKAKVDTVTLTDEQISKYVLMATKPVFQLIFSSIGAGTTDNTYFEKNYEDWMIEDTAKKLLAMLYGEALTKELACNEASGTEGIVATVKAYVKTSEGLGFVKNQLDGIFQANKGDAVDAAYKFIGSVLTRAYEGKTVQNDIKMLFGDGSNAGAFELGMKCLDTENEGANVWINLILSEYVQLNLVSGPLNTVSAANSATAVAVQDNASVSFKTEGLEDYGIGETSLALRNGWFDIACFVGDGATPDNYTKTGFVTYDGSKLQITNDSTKGETYDAYLVLYRKSATDDVTTFIESYPVTIENRSISTNTGGGGSSRYSLSFETNGGTDIKSKLVNRGTTVELTDIPSREGYEFTGWYLDAALTNKVESVVVGRNLTVYAGWAEIKMAEVPEMLNGEEHFAYVVGYPGGEVRPNANITRAETATIIFRLLKDAVRDENLTTENNFSDVNEDNWYNKAVSTLAALNVVNGRTETEFAPDAFVTRAEFATILARFMDEEFSDDNALADIDGHWAEDYVNEATYYGWIKGYEDNTFRPDNNITRAEAMTLINRVLHRLPETTADLHIDMVKWSDNSDTTAWYYLAVQEATNSHSYADKKTNNEKWTGITEGRDWTQYQ